MATARGLVEKFEPNSAWTEDSTNHYLLLDLPGFKKEWLRLNIDDNGHIFASGERHGRDNKIVRFEQNFEVPKNSDIEKISGRFEGEVLYVIVPKKVKEEADQKQNENAHGIEEEHKHAKKNEEADKGTAKVVEEEADKGTAKVVEEDHEHKHEHAKKEHKHEHAKKEEEGDKETADVVEEKHKQAKKEEEGDKGTAKGIDEKHEHSHRHENEENTRMEREEGSREPTREMWRQEAGLLGSVMDILSRKKGIVMTAVLAFSLGVLVSQKFQSNTGTQGGFSHYNNSF